MMGGQPWLSGSICTSHFAALDSNPKGNIHDLLQEKIIRYLTTQGECRFTLNILGIAYWGDTMFES